MNRATQQKLAALKAMVDHPSTPDHERESAEARIRELERKVRKAKKRSSSDHRNMPTSMAEMADRLTRQGLAGLKRQVRGIPEAKEAVVHDDWPFGWDGPREDIGDFERDYFGDDLILAWKCPDCGDHVTRSITAKMALRFAGRSGAMKECEERILSGETNHLCSECWGKWNEL